MKSIVLVLLVALFINSSLQIGTLWVNEIWGNQDTNRVRIEDLVFDDSTMLADFIDGLTEYGVFVEDSQFIEGDVLVPGFMHVFGTATFHGAAFFNQGIFADDGDVNDDNDDGVYSFQVEDNSGRTTIKGMLRPFGGINADNCQFTVANVTGDTRITSALLRPNGGIEVGDALFTVSNDDGSFRTKADGIVSLDFIQGEIDGLSSDKLISRVPAATPYGGNFIIKGQDGVSSGGNLVLIPGDGPGGSGNVLFGRKFPDTIYVGRSGLDSLPIDGGETILGGQSAFDGTGGDLVFLPGRAEVPDGSDRPENFQGGNLLLDVGLSSKNGLPGRIYLGTEASGESAFNLVLRRAVSPDGYPGADTLFVGQSTSGAVGGDLYLQAGDVLEGSGLAGDLAIIPGRTTDSQGDILLGNTLRDLDFTRLPVYSSAGDTYYIGQDIIGTGAPGDLILQAGSTTDITPSRGGDIWIMPGTSEKGDAGEIIWGNIARPLVVSRVTELVGDGALTSLSGQTSPTASGGDYNIAAGNGNDAGGRLTLKTGDLDDGPTTGGDIKFTAGVGRVNGGSVFINGGFGQEGEGGAISINGGDGNVGGSILFSAGVGAANLRGDIIIGPNANSLYVDSALVAVDAPFVTLQSGSNTLVIKGNDLSSILEFNGRKLLRTTVAGVPAPPTGSATDLASAYTILNDLTTTVRGIVCALGQDNHGLVNIVSPSNVNASCPP